LLDEYAEVETALSDPAVHSDQARARTLGRRFASWPRSGPRRPSSRRPAAIWPPPRAAAEDNAFAAEADQAAGPAAPSLEQAAARAVAAEGSQRQQDVILEIKAGEGGDESARSPAICSACTCATADAAGGPTETLAEEPTDLGGIKSGGPSPCAPARRTIRCGAG